LLEHLEQFGFAGSPRVLGFDPDGNEVLSFIDGEAGSLSYPHALHEEEGIVEWGRFVRSYHNAVTSFTPPPDAVWRVGRKPVGPGEIVCHGDFGHWNAVWRDGSVVGAIDWDFAEPDSPLRDLATAALGVVPFLEDQRVRQHFPKPVDRQRRLAVLCDAYEAASPHDVLDAVVAYLQTEAQRVAVFGGEGREPWASHLGRGMDETLKERVRWIETNRAKLA
jgi:thiamine kinase-like enzyme